MARRRNKDGRFAKKAKRRVSARKYTVKRRKNPASKYGPSTRKGQTRITSRRAYEGLRRRRRSNPKPMWQAPAIKYSAVAGIGALAGVYVDTAKWANPVRKDGKPLLGPVRGSVLGSVVTFALAHYAVKGAANKNLVRAAAVGMLINPAIDMVRTGVKAAENNNQIPAPPEGGDASAQGYNNAMARLRANNSRLRLPATSSAAKNFSQASRNLDNAAA